MTKEHIEFLESIYQTDGENNHYSQEFRAAAVIEKNELCQESSALYALIRERAEAEEDASQ